MISDNIIDQKVIIRGAGAEQRPPAVSVLVPTRNEAGNIEKLLDSLKRALDDTRVEVIFIDDSTDETPLVIEKAVTQFSELNIRLIHRAPVEQSGGLGGAVKVGLSEARAEYACVMDGDLQHPADLVPVLLKTAVEGQADLVIATRRKKESRMPGLNLARRVISRGLDLLAHILFPLRLRGVSDPLTGFFVVRVKAVDIGALRPKGFKILLEILVRNSNLRKAEVPFFFGLRNTGTSKASSKEAWRYLSLLLTLRFGEDVLRFAGFAVVGATGILVNSLVLYLGTDKFHLYYLLSAAAATVLSTLWNFSLTELLVYHSQAQSQGRLKRMGLFFVMNLIALGLRTPVIYLLTTVLGVYYVLSNLISLIILTVLRFLLADNLIWGQTPAVSSADGAKAQERGRKVKNVFAYSIHDFVTVVSEVGLPELEPFLVDVEIPHPTLRVRMGIPRKQRTGGGDVNYMRYREWFGHLGFEVGIELGESTDVVASPMLRFSPHVLYTNVVEPLLRWTFVKKGYVLVHGATIAFGDSAYMITARTDTGKTTTLLKILAYQRRNSDRAAFLSDDMTIVGPDGKAWTYPKPLTISAHTLRAVNTSTLNLKEKLALPFQSRIHSRSGRKAAFVISKTHLPAATINMITQMVVPPPKYFVEQLVPKVKLARKADLSGMFIIERGQEAILPMDQEQAMQILLQNCADAYGFPPYQDLEKFLCCHDGIDLPAAEQAMIRAALGKLPATVIRSNTMGWWSQIPAFVNNEQVSSDIARAVEGEGTPRQRFQRQPGRLSSF